jgi:hypothetical protein
VVTAAAAVVAATVVVVVAAAVKVAAAVSVAPTAAAVVKVAAVVAVAAAAVVAAALAVVATATDSPQLLLNLKKAPEEPFLFCADLVSLRLQSSCGKRDTNSSIEMQDTV